MRRWIVAVLLSFGVLLGAPYAAWSASMRSLADLGMVILIPEGRHLEVFQQTTLHLDDSPEAAVDVLPRATHVRMTGGRIVARKLSTFQIVSVRRRFSLRYWVPWDGNSLATSLRIPSNLRILLVLVPPDLSLPAVLNPVMVPVGEGRIPDVPRSPRFAEYAASNLSAGQLVPLVFEGQSPQALDAAGPNPRLAKAFLLAMGLMALAGITAALQWNHRQRRVSALLRRWALLDAAKRRGRVTQGEVIRQRDHLWRRLKMSEDGWHDG